MEIKIQSIKKSVFQKFGQVIEVQIEQTPDINTEAVTFWKQQSIFKINGEIEIGVLKVKKHQMEFNQLENHFETPTGLICLDGDFVIAVSGPSVELPKVDEIHAFHVKKGQAIILNEACWHWTTFPVDKKEITILVFFKKDALEKDTVVKELNTNCKLNF